MVRSEFNPVLKLIHRVVEDQRDRDESDHKLLQRFIDLRDEAAFHTLLRRHGAMVFDVCRSVLGNEVDAEDAFQATFLILARKAASIRKAASVGSWLHGVAYRTAREARARSTTRNKSEARAPTREMTEQDHLTWREVREVLHEELTGLPERYRVPLVMCFLEGKTQDQAAAQLGLAKSTVKERLERGKEFLRARLVRRGLGPAALLVAAAWPAAIASACLPSTFIASTVKAAGLSAVGQATTGVISTKVTALTEGVMKAMFLTKLKIAAAALLLVVAGFGAIVMMAQAGTGSPNNQNPLPQFLAAPDREKKEADNEGAALHQVVQGQTWFVTRVDHVTNTIHFQFHPAFVALAGIAGGGGVGGGVGGAPGGGPGGFPNKAPAPDPEGIALQMAVAKDANVVVDGRPGKLADVQIGMQISLQMATDQPIITRIEASTRGTAILTAVDVEKKAITVMAAGKKLTVPLAAEMRITIPGKLNAQVADLKVGMRVNVQTAVEANRIVVTAILTNAE
jgi:RNA polymerase sigma factor (sigma-70 family)